MTIILDGTTGITTPAINSSGDLELPGGTANGVLYLNGSKVATSGSALVFDGTNMGLGVTPSAWTYFKPLQAVRSGFLGSAGQTGVSYNAYYDGAWKYIANDYALWYSQNATSGQHIWNTAGSGTAGNNITFTQALTLNTSGNLVLQGGSTGANGIGITFPATQVASSDANCLDDYEEGTWTPSVVSGSITGTSITYDGRYTKIGRVVHLFLTIGSSVNNLEVGSYVTFSGLPYSIQGASSGSVTTEDIDLESTSGFCQAGSTTFTLGPCGSPALTQFLFCTVVGIV